MEKQRIVYLGPVMCKGGKEGSRFILERALLENPEMNQRQVDRLVSIFDYKPAGVIGGVYEASTELEDQRIKRLSADRQYCDTIDHPSIIMFAALAMAHAHRKRAKAAEKKAAANSDITPHIDALAAIVSKAGLNDSYAIADAFKAAIHRRAMDMHRAGRR